MSTSPGRLLVIFALGATVIMTLAQQESGDGTPLEATALPTSSGAGAEVRGEMSLAPAFEVVDTRIGVAANDAPAEAVPRALADPPVRVSGPLARDHWTLVFDLRQVASAQGIYEARLVVDDAPSGAIALEAANGSAGATLVFDIGTSLPRSLTYVLTVAPLSVVETRTVELASAPDGSLEWVGRGALDDARKPAIEALVDVPLRLLWHNEDGIVHDLAIKDAGGKLVAGPTERLSQIGATTSLTWTPTSAGEYTYLCRLHAATMGGPLSVV